MTGRGKIGPISGVRRLLSGGLLSHSALFEAFPIAPLTQQFDFKAYREPCLEVLTRISLLKLCHDQVGGR